MTSHVANCVVRCITNYIFSPPGSAGGSSFLQVGESNEIMLTLKWSVCLRKMSSIFTA